MTVAASSFAPRRPDDHVVDALIAERAPRLAASGAWPLLRAALGALLNAAAARRLADELAPLPGAAVMARLSTALGLQVEVQGLEHLPQRGRVILVCNHPNGLADGIAVCDGLRARRRDLVFYANADALRVAPGLVSSVIPVAWRTRAPSAARRTLAATVQAMADERALVVFPSGRISHPVAGGRVAEWPWRPSVIGLAQRFGAPLVPMHLRAPPPRLFHLLGRLSTELRDVTLFHELLAARGRSFRLTLGPAIPPRALSAADTGPLQAYVEHRLPDGPGQAFA